MKTVRETYLNSTLPLVTVSLVLPLIVVTQPVVIVIKQ